MDRTAAVGVIVVVAGLEVNSSQRLLRAGRGGWGSHMLAAIAHARDAFNREARTAAGTSIATKRSAENR